MVERLLEVAGFYFHGQAAVRGKYKAHVHFALLLISHPTEGLAFEQSKQRSLYFKREFSDLIHEQGAFVRKRYQSLLGFRRARKRPLTVTESSLRMSSFCSVPQFFTIMGWLDLLLPI